MAEAANPDLDTLLATVEKLSTYPFKDAAEHRRAERAVQRVADRLKTPYDQILQMWGGGSKDAALKVGIDTGLWEKWKEHVDKGGKEAQTVEDLARMVDVDPHLLQSLLKHLATWNIVNEVGPNTYTPTPLSTQLARREIQGCVELQFGGFTSTFHKLPDFLRQIGYKRPQDPNKSGFSYAYDFPGNFWDYCVKTPSFNDSFARTMEAYTADRGSWVDAYPPQSIVDGADEEGALLVDVGGGKGQDIEKFRRLYPSTGSTPGRLVLQDLESVLQQIKETNGITAMPHDFFTPQPVKHARAYFMHSVPHDWPDDKCRVILQHVKEAMKPGYSKLLINELVGPPTGASPHYTTFDMIMLGTLSSQERDEEAWRELIEGVGLRVVKIWGSPACTESVIEVELPE